MAGSAEFALACERVESANKRRYLALRDFFLRLTDEIFDLPQGFPTDDLAAIRKHVALAENRLPEAILSLSLQAVKDAVLGLIQPSQDSADSAELPADQSAPLPAASTAPQARSGISKRAATSESTVPRPLEAAAAVGILAILGGDLDGRDGGVELVESLEPLVTSVCADRLPPNSQRRGSVAVADPKVPNSVLLLSSAVRTTPLRVAIGAREKRVLGTEWVQGTGWDWRFASAVAAFEGRVYVSGGMLKGRTAADVFVIAGAVEAAEKVPSLRPGRTGHAMLAFAGGLVAVGGLLGAKEPLASVEGLRLGEAGAEWRALPDLPRALHSSGAAVFKGRLFVAGGSTGRGVVKDVYSLGPQLDGWKAEGRLSRSRRSVCLAVFGGRLFALGGVCGFRGSDESWARSVEVFEERDRRWRLLPGRLLLPVCQSTAALCS